MTYRRPNKAARWIGNILLIAGAFALGVWSASFFGVTVWQHWQNHIFEREREARPPVAERAPALPERLQKGDIVGRLAIPRLHLEAMVREGDGERTLSLALGHIPGTALPWQQGNVGVAGHRDRLFRGLRNIAANDEITFETPNSDYTYRVESTQIVKPQDVGVLQPGPHSELTLVTCYPFYYIGSAPDRFIVKARLVTENTAHNEIRDSNPPMANAASHPKPSTRVTRATHDEVSFNVSPGHSRELVPGKIWFGLSSADTARGSVNGWIWVMPDRQTIWLRDIDPHHPVTVHQDGGTRSLVITKIARNSASGYLVSLPG